MSRRDHGRNKHRVQWWTLYSDAYDDVVSAIENNQPLLRLVEDDGLIWVKGRFEVQVNGHVADTFLIRICFPHNYPKELPVVFTVGERIPASLNRHVNSDGSACLYVPEEWLVRRRDNGFATFLNIPLRNYFLGQLYFEEHGRFPPTGERTHHGEGVIEAYADVLNIPPDLKQVYHWLCLLTEEKSKGHWACPCGSGEIIRRCCRTKVHAKRNKIPVDVALRMKRRIDKEIIQQLTKGR